jgi:lysophospholipase L1-like esterase
MTHSSVTAQNPTIILVTPPPINEVHLESEDAKKGQALTRHQSFTAQYGDVIREIVTEFKNQKVVLVDLWQALMEEGIRRSPGQPKEGTMLGSRDDGDCPGFRALFTDGLHFTALAYEVFLKTLLPVLNNKLTEGHKDAVPWIFP